MHYLRNLSGIILLVILAMLSACSGGGGGGEKNSDPEPENQKPIADAGKDFNTLLNTKAILSGDQSYDDVPGDQGDDEDGDPLTYAWVISQSPATSSVTLTDASSIYPSFTADVPGDYLISLTVSDGIDSSLADTVMVKAVSGTSFIPDTDTHNCYSNSGTTPIPCPSQDEDFYGQDAQYSTNPMTFIDNGATVTDLVTGLTWQKEDDGTKYNWYEASGTFHSFYNPSLSNYCGSLNLGGRTNWRLPNVEELLSIMVYGVGQHILPRSKPHPDYFTISTGIYGDFWTAEARSSSDQIWAFYIPVLTNGNGKFVVHSLLCVSGPIWSTNHFLNNFNGTITDSGTGLMWQQGDAGIGLKWKEALSYCENLSLGGHQDWRLPDVKEMESLVNLRLNPPINMNFFSTVGIYWTSTTHMYGAAVYAQATDTVNGYIPLGHDKSNNLDVRCVR